MPIRKRDAEVCFKDVLQLITGALKLIPAEQRSELHIPKESLRTLRDYFSPTSGIQPPARPGPNTYSHAVLEGVWDLKVGEVAQVWVKRRSDAAPILARYMPDKQFVTKVKGMATLPGVEGDSNHLVEVRRTR